jgi:nucleoid-associated protein YgaU
MLAGRVAVALMIPLGAAALLEGRPAGADAGASDGSVRLRAEALAEEASRRFAEVLKSERVAQMEAKGPAPASADSDDEGPWAAAARWIERSDRAFQAMVRKLARGAGGAVSAAANGPQSAPSAPQGAPKTAPAAPPGEAAAEKSTEGAAQWLAQSGERFRSLMRRLAEGTPQPAPKGSAATTDARGGGEGSAGAAAKAAPGEPPPSRVEAKRPEDGRLAERRRAAVATGAAEVIGPPQEAASEAEANKQPAAKREPQKEEKRAKREKEKLEGARKSAERRAAEDRQAGEAQAFTAARAGAPTAAEADKGAKAGSGVTAGKGRGAGPSEGPSGGPSEGPREGSREAPREAIAAAAEAARQPPRVDRSEERSEPGARRASAGRQIAVARPRQRVLKQQRRIASRSCEGAGRSIAPPGWYVVKRRDTLWRIAARHYGAGRRYLRIYAANRHRLRNPDWIFPCQRLYLPGPAKRRIQG